MVHCARKLDSNPPLSRQGIRPLTSTLFSRFSRLGLKGRSDESNLPGLCLAVSGTNAYVCLDADTLCYGIQQVIAAKRWPPGTPGLAPDQTRILTCFFTVCSLP